MIVRKQYLQKLKKKLANNPAVVIVGARQVGKTTIAKEINSEVELTYVDLESPNSLNAIMVDVEAFLKSKHKSLVVLDEVQVYPPIFAALRSIIDEDRRNSRFLLLGSANVGLIRGVSESLAGRVSYLELPPLSLQEVGFNYQEIHWFRGGYPQAFLAESDEVYTEWATDYIKSYAERDINLIFQINLNSLLVRRLWTMLGHLTGVTLNSADLGRSLGVTANTVNNYIEVLEGAFLIKRLQPWYVNVGKRLVKSPKLYFTDTGLLHSLMGIKSYDDLMVHPIVGASWENYVIIQITNAVQDRFEPYFYRTHNGSEVDLILVDGITPFVSIEIKSSNNPNISKGFYLSIDDLKTPHNFVITKHKTYFNTKGILICSLSDFIKEELPRLMSPKKA